MNGDVFYYNYYNEQVPLSVVNTNTGQIVPILYNVPLAHNYGVELWGTWRPIDPLTISLSYSYLSAKVANSACVEDTVDPQAIQPGANTTAALKLRPTRPLAPCSEYHRPDHPRRDAEQDLAERPLHFHLRSQGN